MTEPGWEALRALLVVKYDDFCRRLTRRLGSADLAKEALHEAYLQLDRKDEAASVHRPEAYLFRIVFNIALGWKRTEARRASPLEIEDMLDFADECAQTERAVEARFDIEALERAIEELTPRQRTIFWAVRVEEVSIQTVTESLGVSRRLVEQELAHALAHCAQRLGRQVTRRFGPKALETSYRQAGRKIESPS